MATDFPSTTTTVRWRYRKDDSLAIATGTLLRDRGSTLCVELVRDGKSSGQILEIPRTHAEIDLVTVSGTLRDRFKMGMPSEKQLALINTFLPSGAPPLTQSEVITVPFVAADNLVNRSLDRWDIPSLAAMAKLLPGLPSLLDHDWDDVSKTWGKIYNAQLVRTQDASREVLDRAGNLSANQQIAAQEGLAQVVCEVFAPADSPVIQALKSGLIGGMSTGGFRFTDYHCPLCNSSFSDAACPHVPPDPYWGLLPGEDSSIAPYAIRVGLFDMGEASVVTIPNLPNAGVI